ncbi:MAG: polysaccharide deacetylase family protein [Myxococcales bacterium]|nr:polysaccharide deacetylase family protein [Myxococcales bacterium]
MRGRKLRYLGFVSVLLCSCVVACAASNDASPQGNGGSGASSGSGPGGGANGGTSGASGSGGSGGSGGSVENPPVECSGSETDAGGFTFIELAKWKDNAKAAYSMIHDDACGPGLRGIDQLAVPALNARGLKAGIAPFVQACEEGQLWDLVKQIEAAGHEIVNHSYTHPEISVANAPTEVVGAKAEFEKYTQNPVTFYIFPFDYFTPETISAVGNAGHIGARAGNRDDNDGFDNPPINSADPGKDLEVEFDVWPRTYSKYALFKAEDILSVHVWNAIERGGWALREFHSVSQEDAPPTDGSQGFGPVPLKTYEAHLDFLVDAYRAGEVWTATPSTVVRYRHARSACKASLSGNTLTYDATASDCQQFATPVSAIVKTGNDVASLQALQGGTAIETRKLGPSTFSVTADPTLGDVELAGCAVDGPTVSSQSIPTKPEPAASVCDLQQVIGSGSPGNMDDLERDSTEFQVLPNPSQGDGRDGTWSWYPQNVDVQLYADGTNHVLRYAGSNLGAWTGVTLAFLGGNGAGACYDGSAYQGLRFKIKGSVNTSDELNGKAIVSLVTAETQTRVYGGDLNGEGGHFNKQIAVTSAWQTVEIRWSDFDKPTWGPTTALSAVAVKKLQAIDWGISDKATAFELFIDDVELF